MLKPLFTASVVSLAILAACSSDDTTDDTAPPNTPPSGQDAGGGTSSSGAAVTPHQGCSTIQPTFTVKAPDWFHVFKDEAEAVAYYSALIPSRKLRPAGSESAKKGQAATTRAYEAFKKIYPGAVEGMTTAPIVVIEEKTEPNAYAMCAPTWEDPDGTAKVGYIFTYTSAYIDDATDDELAYVAAHELGHLLLRYDALAFENKYYVVASQDDEKTKVFGEYQPNSEKLEAAIEKLSLVGDRGGQCAIKELVGIPTRLGADSGEDEDGARYGRYLTYLHRDKGLKGAKAADCQKADQIKNQVYSLLTKHIGDGEYAEIQVGTDGPAMEKLANDYWTAEASCLSVITATYAAAAGYAKQNYEDIKNYPKAVKAANGDKAKFAAYLQLSKLELDADTAQPTQNIALKFRDLGVKVHEVMRTLYATPEFNAIRVYTHEDEADLAAVREAKVMGIDPNVRVGKLLKRHTPAYQTSCRTKIDKGDVPTYGDLFEPHHGDCWRGWRTLLAADALKSCSADWPSKP